MKRSLKTRRLRGSRTYGEGPQRKTGAGQRGGTGNAGSFTHKFVSKVLAEKRALREKKSINLRDLNERKDTLVRKGYLKKKTRVAGETFYKTTTKFANKYKKIIGIGELSYKLRVLKPTKLSASARAKIL